MFLFLFVAIHQTPFSPSFAGASPNLTTVFHGNVIKGHLKSADGFYLVTSFKSPSSNRGKLKVSKSSDLALGMGNNSKYVPVIEFLLILGDF